MVNAEVIIESPEFKVPVCDRGHSPTPMTCTVQTEGITRFLCNKCVMRTFVVKRWLANMIVTEYQKVDE